MTFEEMAKKRYSVKKFKNTPVEPEKLQKIFEVAGIAPTARNAQAARIYVIKSPEALKKANELTSCIYGAPIALLFTYSTKEYYPYPKEPTQHSGDEDAAILATHVMFEALEQGLGTCWVNCFTPTEAKKAFDLPEDEYPVLFMPLGYAAEDAKPLANHMKKKPLGDIVKEL